VSVLLAGPNSGSGGPGPILLFDRPLGIRWEGPNGAAFELNDGLGDVRAIPGIGGLGMPSWTSFVTSSAAEDGQTVRSVKADPKEFVLPVAVKSRTGRDWLLADADFFASLDPFLPGRLVVTNPFTSSTRTLECRLVDDGGATYDMDPAVAAWASYGLRMIADQPFFLGDPIEKSFAREPDMDFRRPAGGKWVSRSSNTGNATMPNPGSEPAYFTAKITGGGDDGLSSWAVGVDGKRVGGDIPLAPTRWATVDTHPKALSVRLDDGTSLIGELSEGAFAWIAPGARVPVDFLLEGVGSVLLKVVPRHRKAW
jgi:hypothetical protein